MTITCENYFLYRYQKPYELYVLDDYWSYADYYNVNLNFNLFVYNFYKRSDLENQHSLLKIFDKILSLNRKDLPDYQLKSNMLYLTRDIPYINQFITKNL